MVVCFIIILFMALFGPVLFLSFLIFLAILYYLFPHIPVLFAFLLYIPFGAILARATFLLSKPLLRFLGLDFLFFSLASGNISGYNMRSM